MNKYQVILDEQFFPYENMSLEERNYYLRIIKNCKDICDSENKVGNVSNSELIKLHLKKENNIVTFNGVLTIGNDKLRENRCIDGYLFIEDDSVIVDYKITRVCIEDEHKEYSVLDEFKIENDTLKRRSQYSYNMISLYDEIDDEIMKGKIK